LQSTLSNGLEIARTLNVQGILADFGREWHRATAHKVVTNEIYMGVVAS